MLPLLPLLLAATQCPPGTVAKGAAPPASLHAWCEDELGRKEGPELEWFGPARPRSERGWHEGKLQGAWRAWREDGTLWMDDTFERGERVPQQPAGGSPGSAAASSGAARIMLDPARHPRADALRAHVKSLGEAARRRAAAAAEELISADEKRAKLAGGSSRRWSEGERRYLFTDVPASARRLLVDLELQLGVTVVLDRGTRACSQLVSYPDPTGAQPGPITESTTLDCSALRLDPDLGPALASLPATPLPWIADPAGGPPRVERLSSLLDLSELQFEELSRLGTGTVRYGSTVLRVLVVGPKGERVASLTFTRDEGSCEALFEELRRELGTPEPAPAGGRYSHFWTLGSREVGFLPTALFVSERDRAAARCDVELGAPGSKLPRAR